MRNLIYIKEDNITKTFTLIYNIQEHNIMNYHKMIIHIIDFTLILYMNLKQYVFVIICISLISTLS